MDLSKLPQHCRNQASKPRPDSAPKLLPFSPLIAQKTLLIGLDGLQVSIWVTSIVQPILN
jgi:hypothetical protein